MQFRHAGRSVDVRDSPVAIWNGLDASVWPPRATTYDEVAIYTGSALVLDGAGPGELGAESHDVSSPRGSRKDAAT